MGEPERVPNTLADITDAQVDALHAYLHRATVASADIDLGLLQIWLLGQGCNAGIEDLRALLSEIGYTRVPFTNLTYRKCASAPADPFKLYDWVLKQANSLTRVGLPPDAEGVWVWADKAAPAEYKRALFRTAQRDAEGALAFYWPMQGRPGLTAVHKCSSEAMGSWVCVPLPAAFFGL